VSPDTDAEEVRGRVELIPNQDVLERRRIQLEGEEEDPELRQQRDQRLEEEDLRPAAHPMPRSRNKRGEHRRIWLQLHLQCPVWLGEEGRREEEPPSVSLPGHYAHLSRDDERRALLRIGQKQQHLVHVRHIPGRVGR
jgi:hypothetical protein